MIKQLMDLVNKGVEAAKEKEQPKTEILKIQKPKETTTLPKLSK